MCVGEDLVAHAPKQIGRGLRGQDEGLHDRWGQLADHAPHSTRQSLLFVAPRRHITDGLSCVQDTLWRWEVSTEVRVGRLVWEAGLGLLTSRTVS